ncbi:MAG: hypothetical protein V5A68_07100 [Candidatus Thermoplasmatota archaeon]
MENSYILEKSLNVLCSISSRRTSRNFVNKVMNRIRDILQESYPFLSYIKIQDGYLENGITIEDKVNEIDTKEVCQAIGSIIRILTMDLGSETGLYFLSEFKQKTGNEIISKIQNSGVDLNLLEIEQRHVFKQKQKKEENIAGDSSLLGYTWNDVSEWKYDDLNKVCILYDSQKNVLDKLNLDAIIESHIKRISGQDEKINQTDDIKNLNLDELETKFLDLFKSRKHSKAINIVLASALLQTTENELEKTIEGLADQDLIEFEDVDSIKLSGKGMKYLSDLT